MTWPRILLHISLERTLDTQTFWHFWQIAAKGYPLTRIPPDRTDVQRNLALKMLRDSDGTHLCLLDSDHIHPADVVERLAQHVIDDPDKLVVAGLNFSRHDGHACASVNMRPLTQWEPGLIEVTSTGAAAMLIAREVVETVPAPWFAYTYPTTESGLLHPGTDHYFSGHMAAHGVKMWVDTTLTSPHLTTGTVPEMRPKVEAQMVVLPDHVTRLDL